MADLSNLRKRRSSTKGSITKLFNRMKALESKTHEASTLDLAHQLMPNLQALDNQFKTQHYSIVDAIDEKKNESPTKEQDVLDKHNDEVAELSLRITQLVRNCDIASDSSARKVLSRRLADLKTRLEAVGSAAGSLTSSAEHIPLLHQYHEKLNDLKVELSSVRQATLTAGIGSTDNLFGTISRLDNGIFDATLNIKKLLHPNSNTASVASEPATDTVLTE